MKTMKKILSLVMTLAMVLSMGSITPITTLADSNIYEIKTAEQLMTCANLVNNGTAGYCEADVTYKLMNDIDLSQYTASGGWTPIGSVTKPFNCNFDGNNKVVTGLKINRTGTDYQGLFGVTSSTSEIKNLGVNTCTIEGGSYVGGISGYAGGKVSNCFVTGYIVGINKVGGVVGVAADVLADCYSSDLTVSGTDDAGGIAGDVGGVVSNCYSTALIRGSAGIGGVAGTVTAAGEVNNCIALNRYVRATLSSVGRVAGTNAGTLLGNLAFEGMTTSSGIAFSGEKTGDGRDGADMSKLEAVNAGIWMDMGFDLSIWTFEIGLLPVLAGISGQNGDPGLYLTVLPGNNAMLSITPEQSEFRMSELPKQIVFTVTGMEGWTHSRIDWTTTHGLLSYPNDKNGEATLTIPENIEPDTIITITASNESSGKSVQATVVPTIVVTGVSLSESALTLDVGDYFELNATVAPENAADRAVTWSSEDTSVAAVTDGVVRGIKAGTTKITVTTNDGGKTASCTVTVNAVTVAVTGVTLNKTSTTLNVGDEEELSEMILPSDATNQTVSWSSEDPSVATVTDGVVKGIKAGTAKITVTTNDGGKTASCTVTVNAVTVAVTGVTLNKTSTTLNVGGEEKLSEMILPSNATNQAVTWSSEDPSVATVTDGVVKGIKAGTAKITVTTNDGGKTASCTVTVSAGTVAVTGVTLNKSTATLNVGASATLTATVTPSNATNKVLSWSSDNMSVATVTNGVVKGIKAGTAKITVRTGDGGKTAVCMVTVKQPVKSVKTLKSVYIVKGKSVTLPYVAAPEDATDKGVTWSGKSKSIVTVNSKTGKVTGKKVGKTTVTVKTADGGKTAKCTVYVVKRARKLKSIKISPNKAANLVIGKTLQIKTTLKPKNATGIVTKYKSGNAKVATVDKLGKVTAKAAGKTTITVTAGNKKKSFTLTVGK